MRGGGSSRRRRRAPGDLVLGLGLASLARALGRLRLVFMRSSEPRAIAADRDCRCLHSAPSRALSSTDLHAGNDVLRRYEKAIDSASLQRVAELKAFRLVREGADLETVEGAEIANIGLFDVAARLLASCWFCLATLLPERFRLVLGAAGGELQAVVAAACGRRCRRRVGGDDSRLRDPSRSLAPRLAVTRSCSCGRGRAAAARSRLAAARARRWNRLSTESIQRLRRDCRCWRALGSGIGRRRAPGAGAAPRPPRAAAGAPTCS